MRILILNLLCVPFRAQQQEQREMKLRLQQEVDPGNPNWEFIQMIRCLNRQF